MCVRAESIASICDGASERPWVVVRQACRCHVGRRFQRWHSQADSCNLVTVVSNLAIVGVAIVVQVSRATHKSHAHNKGLLSGLSEEQEPALLEGSAQQLTGEQA